MGLPVTLTGFGKCKGARKSLAISSSVLPSFHRRGVRWVKRG